MASAKKKVDGEAVPGTEEPLPDLPGSAEENAPEPIKVGTGETATGVATGDGSGHRLPEADPSTYPPDAKPLEPIAGGLRRYRVWAHGALHYDLVVYAPGDEIALDPKVGDALECLEAID